MLVRRRVTRVESFRRLGHERGATCRLAASCSASGASSPGERHTSLTLDLAEPASIGRLTLKSQFQQGYSEECLTTRRIEGAVRLSA
jgi:hypothetical protein